MITSQAKRFALSAAILAACTAGRARAEDIDLHKALGPCSGISISAERLACYDRLAGRAPEPKARLPAAAAAPGPAPGTAPAPAVPVTAPAPAPTTKEFGLSKVQKASSSSFPAEAKSITAKVAGFSRAPNGRTRVTLDNEEVWEYQDAPDLLLSIGDSVTIKRALLGSFILVTPTKVSHRVSRID